MDVRACAERMHLSELTWPYCASGDWNQLARVQGGDAIQSTAGLLAGFYQEIVLHVSVWFPTFWIQKAQ